MPRRTDKSLVLEWYQRYIYERLTQKEIAKIYGVSRDTVIYCFKRYGLKARPANRIRVNVDSFKNIDDELSAYWLGFIYADGYVSDKNNFEVTLQERDYWHLVKLKHYLMADVKIGYKESVKAFRFGFQDKQLVDNLKKWGVHPRKSLTLKYPQFLREDLHRHFIRGYWDGDGSLGIYNMRESHRIDYLSLSVIGTLDVICEIMKRLPIDTNHLKLQNKYEGKNTYQICFVRRKAEKVLNWIYSDANIFLDRKKKIYEKAKKMKDIEGQLKLFTC